jgi:ADP-heptose:LPS heptosyltransferase
MDSGKKTHIVVIKTDGIGDAVLASPFLFELRKHYRDAFITGILSPAGQEVLGALNVFDDIKVIDPQWLKYKKVFFIKRWASAMQLLFIINKIHPDVAIALRWQDRLTSLVLSLCNAGRKIGYDVAGMGFGIDVKIPVQESVHTIYRNLNVLSALLPGKKFKIKTGISCGESDVNKIKSILKANKIKKYVVVHPISGHTAKDWGIDNFKCLAEKIAKKADVVIIGGKEDRDINLISGKNVLNLAGQLSIRETAALIKNSSFVIGNDSAAVHVASVFNVKSLTLFSGTVDYRCWKAWGKNSHVIMKKVPCSGCELIKCNQQLHPCMDFSVGEVYKKFLSLYK